MELFLREEFRPDRAPCDRHVQRERAAALPWAMGAIAAVEQWRKRLDPVADRTARAAAGHGKRRSRRVHDQPRSKLRSKIIRKLSRCDDDLRESARSSATSA